MLLLIYSPVVIVQCVVGIRFVVEVDDFSIVVVQSDVGFLDVVEVVVFSADVVLCLDFVMSVVVVGVVVVIVGALVVVAIHILQ